MGLCLNRQPVGIDDRTLVGQIWGQTKVTLALAYQLLQLDLGAFSRTRLQPLKGQT